MQTSYDSLILEDMTENVEDDIMDPEGYGEIIDSVSGDDSVSEEAERLVGDSEDPTNDDNIDAAELESFNDDGYLSKFNNSLDKLNNI